LQDTHAHIQTHTHSLSHTQEECARNVVLEDTHAHTHTHTHSLSHTHTGGVCAERGIGGHTRTHTDTHTHTHSHTHTGGVCAERGVGGHKERADKNQQHSWTQTCLRAAPAPPRYFFSVSFSFFNSSRLQGRPGSIPMSLRGTFFLFFSFSPGSRGMFAVYVCILYVIHV